MVLRVIFLAAPVRGAISFTEDFSNNTAGPNMDLGTAFGSPGTDFTGDFSITGSQNNNRVYLGTNGTDYSTTGFTFEATVTMSGGDNPWAGPFLGMGSRDVNLGGSGEPESPRVLVHLLLLGVAALPDRIRSLDDITDFVHDNDAGTRFGARLPEQGLQ